MVDNNKVSRRSILSAAGLAMASGFAVPATADHNGDAEQYPETCDGPGFNDTPVQPWSGWRFGDACRPQPPTVDPGEPTFSEPPADATVLLGDGSNGEISLDDWESPDGSPPEWNVTEKYAEVNGDWLQSKEAIGDAHYHVEWRIPSDTSGSGQGPGNSGVWLASNYEIQVLNSYENPTYADGMAGALYGEHPPLVNAARPPGEWQSYDIIWRAPRFKDNGDVESPGIVTVYWNDILVQSKTVVHGSTPYKALPEYSPHPPEMPLQLQNHGRPVQYRNIWYDPLPTPASVVTFNGDQLTTKDRTTNLEASISNSSSSTLTSVDVTLTPPNNSGVKVLPKGKTSVDTVETGSSESVSWTVVRLPFADNAPHLLTATVSYTIGSEQEKVTYQIPLYPEPTPENSENEDTNHSCKDQ
ncbi:hypothetical protein DMJ13_17660 [halophilic archaeon]|nr:hypothetical protein DMJ13_17660 [halophilic archaeon]